MQIDITRNIEEFCEKLKSPNTKIQCYFPPDTSLNNDKWLEIISREFTDKDVELVYTDVILKNGEVEEAQYFDRQDLILSPIFIRNKKPINLNLGRIKYCYSDAIIKHASLLALHIAELLFIVDITDKIDFIQRDFNIISTPIQK